MSYYDIFSLLQSNDSYRLLYIGQFISGMALMVISVALPYQVYHETQSILSTGLLSGVQILFLLGTALFGGVFADRYSRRSLLLIAELFFTITCLLLGLNCLFILSNVWLIFIVVPILSIIMGMHRPALTGFIQQIIARENYPASGVLRAFQKNICKIIGAAISGIIIAHFGLFVVYLVSCISFMISLLMIYLTDDISKIDLQSNQSFLQEIKEGFYYVISRQELLASYLIDFVAMVFGMPISLFPAIAQNLGSTQYLGMLYSSLAIGAFIVSIFISFWIGKIKCYGLIIASAASFWGVGIILFGFTKNIYMAIFFLILAGCGDTISSVFRSIMYNETIPNKLRGRLSGIEMICYTSGPKFGDIEACLVAAIFGISISIISGGILCVAGILICCYYLPKFVYYKSQ